VGDLVPFSGLVVGKEGKTVLVVFLEQYDSAGDRTVGFGRSKGHCVGFEPFGQVHRAEFIEPGPEKIQGIFGKLVTHERAESIIASEVMDGHGRKWWGLFFSKDKRVDPPTIFFGSNDQASWSEEVFDLFEGWEFVPLEFLRFGFIGFEDPFGDQRHEGPGLG